jgi:adenylylsulfate kinase-like enzyme
MVTIKITGEPGAGKTTLAVLIARALREAGLEVEHLDDKVATKLHEDFLHIRGEKPHLSRIQKVGIQSE